jgi:hypothetical protein
MASNLEREVRRNLDLRQELGVEVAKGLAMSNRRPAYEADNILNLSSAEIVDKAPVAKQTVVSGLGDAGASVPSASAGAATVECHAPHNPAL